MNQYDNNMQIILTKVVSDKPNAPALRVNFEMNGQKFKASLWQWITKDGRHINDTAGNPKFLGKIEIDDYVPDQQGGYQGQQPQQPQQQPYQQQQMHPAQPQQVPPAQYPQQQAPQQAPMNQHDQQAAQQYQDGYVPPMPGNINDQNAPF